MKVSGFYGPEQEDQSEQELREGLERILLFAERMYPSPVSAKLIADQARELLGKVGKDNTHDD